MTIRISPLAGHPAPVSLLVDVPRLVMAYYTVQPDPGVTSLDARPASRAKTVVDRTIGSTPKE